MKFNRLYESLMNEGKDVALDSLSITMKNGTKVTPSKSQLNISAKILTLKKSNFIIDTGELEGWTFIVGENCTITAGNHCKFRTGNKCTIRTGDYCSFDIGNDCVVESGNYCNFNGIGGKCTITAGDHCKFESLGEYSTFNTGKDCSFRSQSNNTFNTGARCNFETKISCTFTTGNNCNFLTSQWCIFNIGSNCGLRVLSINTQTFNSFGKNNIVNDLNDKKNPHKLTKELVDKLAKTKIKPPYS